MDILLLNDEQYIYCYIIIILYFIVSNIYYKTGIFPEFYCSDLNNLKSYIIFCIIIGILVYMRMMKSRKHFLEDDVTVVSYNIIMLYTYNIMRIIEFRSIPSG